MTALVWVGSLILLVGLLAVAALFAARAALGDSRVPVAAALAGPGERMLVVTAHPDDEIAMAGTVSRVVAGGAEVILLCLTHGEASRSAQLDGLVGAEAIGRARLTEARGEELRSAAAALGVRSVTILDLPDGAVPGRIDEAVAAVQETIGRQHPDVILTLDDVVGLYGHPDHVASAQAARTAWERGDDATRLFQVALPRRQVALARRFSPVFRRSLAGRMPPEPTVAVRIGRAARAKQTAIDAHRTQRAVLGDIQPLSGVIPRSLYFRVLDREYFTEVRRMPQPGGPQGAGSSAQRG